MITPSKFAHVVYKTPRLDEMIEWYERVLGAHIAFRNDFIAFLTYDDEHHRVALVKAPEPGVEHVAFTYESLTALVDTYTRLRDSGVTPYWTIDHGPTTSMYYRDPDGNQIELQVDNFPDAEALHAFFHSETFAANPIGVDFDPEDLTATVRET